MATARPVVSVFSAEKPSPDNKSAKAMCLPQVFSAPLRADLVRLVHTNLNKNKRQAYSVKFEAGYDTAAASWGTGRAVARIPRVPGGGTHRSGQGAFGNMCRGGGMFNPTKTWRKWHRKTNITQKRHAIAAALAATAVPALVMARGHKVSEVPELPLVISDEANKIAKTKDALALLKALGAAEDLERVKASRKIRAGRGKARNRRYTMRKGPIVVHAMDKEETCEGSSLVKAFRNLPGVDVAHVDRLNLLQLAPGGAIGRFAIFTQGAVKRLGALFGTLKGGSEKKGYTLPRAPMMNTDISRIINSNEIQSVLAPQKLTIKHVKTKKNPLKSTAILGRLCPFAPTEKRRAKLANTKGSRLSQSSASKVKKTAEKRKARGNKNQKFYKELMSAYETAPTTEETAEKE